MVHMQGGLGNQLFQLSTGIAASKKFSRPLIINCGRFKRDRVYNRTLEVENVLNINYPYKKLYMNAVLEKVLTGCSKVSTRIDILQNSVGDLHFPQNLHTKNKLLILDGYWQSNVFFDSIEDEMSRIYNVNVPLPISDESKQIASKKRPVRCIIHVRQFTKNNDNVDTSYYLAAIQHVKNKYECENYLVVSETTDPINAFSETFPTLKFSYQASDIKTDFYTMTTAKYFIGSNSTFSWWAAFLNKQNAVEQIFPSQIIHGETTAWGFPGLLQPGWTLI